MFTQYKCLIGKRQKHKKFHIVIVRCIDAIATNQLLQFLTALFILVAYGVSNISGGIINIVNVDTYGSFKAVGSGTAPFLCVSS